MTKPIKINPALARSFMPDTSVEGMLALAADGKLPVLKMLVTEGLQKQAAKLYKTMIRHDDTHARFPSFLLELDALLLAFNDGNVLEQDQQEDSREDDGDLPVDDDAVDDAFTDTSAVLDEELRDNTSVKFGQALAIMATVASDEDGASAVMALANDILEIRADYDDFYAELCEAYNVADPHMLEDEVKAEFFSKLESAWPARRQELCLTKETVAAGEDRDVKSLLFGMNGANSEVDVQGLVRKGSLFVAELTLNGNSYKLKLEKAHLASLQDRIAEIASRAKYSALERRVLSKKPSNYKWHTFMGAKATKINHNGTTYTVKPGAIFGCKEVNSKKRRHIWVPSVHQTRSLSVHHTEVDKLVKSSKRLRRDPINSILSVNA